MALTSPGMEHFYPIKKEPIFEPVKQGRISLLRSVDNSYWIVFGVVREVLVRVYKSANITVLSVVKSCVDGPLEQRIYQTVYKMGSILYVRSNILYNILQSLYFTQVMFCLMLLFH